MIGFIYGALCGSSLALLYERLQGCDCDHVPIVAVILGIYIVTVAVEAHQEFSRDEPDTDGRGSGH